MGNHEHKHHILSGKIAGAIFVALIIGTIVTVWSAKIDLGALNFPLAMLIATIKASLVIFFFMGLLYDSNDNRAIFFTSFVFVFIFLSLTWTDIFFRGDVYVKKGEPLLKAAQGEIVVKNFWKRSDETLAHGKKIYDVQCLSCHGATGKGDGVASAALNPKPRNFTDASAQWQRGRKPSEVFKTVTSGFNSMPAFGSLPVDDRWSLAHYVLSLGAPAPADSPSDLTALGIDTSKADGGMGAAAATSIPVDLAIELMAEE